MDYVSQEVVEFSSMQLKAFLQQCDITMQVTAVRCVATRVHAGTNVLSDIDAAAAASSRIRSKMNGVR